ncbi:MAG: dephospho-CoA kinase [Chloroflexota bacterium]
MYLIGITGNIATGKSTVDDMLAQKGALVLDADALVHDIQRKGEPTWQGIVDRFGRGILRSDEELDRGRLGALVFSDGQALRDLEGLVHPEVERRAREWIQAAPSGAVLIIDAIKLIESGMAASGHSLWVVVCRPEQQFWRLTHLRGLTPELARRRIDAQPPQAEKVSQASVVIDNRGSLEHTQAQVDAAWAGTAGAWHYVPMSTSS